MRDEPFRWSRQEDPALKALTGQLIWVGNERREVVWAVSAGELLDDLARWQRWRRGSAAEACAMWGGRRNWNRDE